MTTNNATYPIICPNMNYNSGTIDGPTKASASAWTATYANIEVPLTGEWYWEVITDDYVYAFPGIQKVTTTSSQQNHDFAIVQNGQYRYNGTGEADTTNIGTGDIIGIYVNAGAIKVYVNNTLDHTYGTNMSAEGGPYFPSFIGSAHCTVNFGQDSSFLGVKTAQGNTDGNGFGDFYYTPPGNALALCSANTPIGSGIDPSETDDDYGSKQFGFVSWSGTGGSNAITGLGFEPDLVWIKRFDDTAGWKVTDTTRGVTKVLQPTGNNAESTDSNGLTAFGSDGFTVGSDSGYNASSGKIGAFAFRANGGTEVTNNDGTLTTNVQANVAAGFSIIRYTGNATNNTIGHGLSAAPDFMIFKCTTSTDNWVVYHREMGAGNRAQLNNPSIGFGSSSASFQSTHPDSSVITIGTSSGTNNNTGTMICYAWHAVEGYSNFGFYTGNAADPGPFVNTGFQPKMIWFKRNGSGDWIVNTYDEDSVDTSYINNQTSQFNNRIRIANNVRETAKPVNFLSNGFQIMHTDSDSNLSGTKYPVIAWGDVPAKFPVAF